jgi:hypothetical protein
VIFLIVSSCTTLKRCNLKFPQVASYDSIYIEKIDTFKIVLPGDSVKIVTKVPCDNFELIQQNGRLTQSLKVVNGILSSYIKIKPDTIYRFKTNTVTITREVKVPEKIKFIPKFWKFTGWTGIGFIIALLVWLGLKLKKLIKI